MSARTLKTPAQILEGWIRDRTVPGVSARVFEANRVVWDRVLGKRQTEPVALPLERGLFYDLASLTKPLATALAVHLLSQRGALRLDDPARKFLPQLDARITLSQLLCHSSGLPAWHPFYLSSRPLSEQLGDLRPRTRPGFWVTYSCVGYIALALIIARVAAQPFSRFVQTELLDVLAPGQAYLPLPPEWHHRAVPTEQGNRYEQALCLREHRREAEGYPWRTALIVGSPHDSNAWHYGSETGNAGLFATAEGVMLLAREAFPSQGRLLDERSRARLWKNRTFWLPAHRTQGFKRNSSWQTSGGPSLPRRAIGHNGFTGTSLWLDPRLERGIILLTNRVHPRVPPPPFDPLRRALHQSLYRTPPEEWSRTTDPASV